MNRLEFMKELEALLSDMPQSEREEALQYYNDYLNDAGVENEQEVLDSLGTPQDLAKVIKEGLNDGGEGGEFTETGYKNEAFGKSLKNEIAKKERIKKDSAEKKSETSGRKPLSGGMIALLVILCIIAFPVLAGIAAGVLGAGVGIFGGILGLVVGVAAAAIALFAAAVILIGFGIATLATVPLAGLCFIGVGILLAGFSLFFLWLTVWIFAVAIPWVIRWIVKICGRLFHRKEEQNV